jgi:propanediol dehydratase large subunit
MKVLSNRHEGYITAATDDYDRMFDGESFDANDYVDFYSICQDKKLVIQGKALPFDPSDTIQLGYSANFSFTYYRY